MGFRPTSSIIMIVRLRPSEMPVKREPQSGLPVSREDSENTYRVHDSHFRNSDFTKGVRRVRLNWSPSLRMASACVGYG